VHFLDRRQLVVRYLPTPAILAAAPLFTLASSIRDDGLRSTTSLQVPLHGPLIDPQRLGDFPSLQAAPPKFSGALGLGLECSALPTAINAAILGSINSRALPFPASLLLHLCYGE
jgi:hypothetical protein